MSEDGTFYLDVGSLIPPNGAVPGTIRKAALEDLAHVVMDTITASWPVASGTSLAGFDVKPAGDSWAVRNDVDYTSFVDDGLVDRLAQAGLRKAEAKVDAIVQGYLARAGGERPRVAFGAQRKQGNAQALAKAAASLQASGAAPAPVLELYRQGRVAEAVALLGKLNKRE